MSNFDHVPVLLEEVVKYLDPQPGQVVIDGTVGLGGHALTMLERISPKGLARSPGTAKGKLLGIDKDRANLERAKKRLASYKSQATLVEDSYLNIKQIAYDRGFYPADSILLDLGFSSVHIEDHARGFSFRNEGPLDMRYDLNQELTAANIINTWSLQDLEQIFRQLGEERNAHKIAAAIVRARQQEPINSTIALAKVIKDAAPLRNKHFKIHPATRVFQALRIAVNDELSALEQTLPQALGTLRPGGRLAVISFHSLEDRIVKQTFKKLDGTKIKLITKKPVTPTEEEISTNPRARSAKLRVAERMR